VSTRARIVTFGSAGLLFVAGALCLAWVGGALGAVLATVLMAFGLGGALLLVFLEIGLGEDRARAAESRRRRPALDPDLWRRGRRPRRPT
jgi:hypothetical protein